MPLGPGSIKSRSSVYRSSPYREADRLNPKEADMKFSGIDLHSNNCFVVIIDEADRIMYGRRLPNKLSGILAALAPYRDELDGVVVESTYNWYWLGDGLMAG